MSPRSSQDRCGTVAVGLHWASAALVLAQLAMLAALFVMHVVGVVTYQRTKGDVFSRMGITGLASGDAAAMTTTAVGSRNIEASDS